MVVDKNFTEMVIDTANASITENTSESAKYAMYAISAVIQYHYELRKELLGKGIDIGDFIVSGSNE